MLCRVRWTALVTRVYEVASLRCPNCGAEMEIISFIEKPGHPDVVVNGRTRIRRLHCHMSRFLRN